MQVVVFLHFRPQSHVRRSLDRHLQFGIDRFRSVQSLEHELMIARLQLQNRFMRRRPVRILRLHLAHHLLAVHIQLESRCESQLQRSLVIDRRAQGKRSQHPGIPIGIAHAISQILVRAHFFPFVIQASPIQYIPGLDPEKGIHLLFKSRISEQGRHIESLAIDILFLMECRQPERQRPGLQITFQTVLRFLVLSRHR